MRISAPASRGPRLFALFAGLALLALALPAASAGDEVPESRMWQRLKQMDANGDGKVTKDEFRGPGRMWERLDRDADGTVTRKEADTASKRMRDRGGERGGDRGGMNGRPGGRGGMGGMGGMAGRGGLGFEKLDLDHNGEVSKREWAAFLEKADENKDGILQKEEWDAAVGGGPMKDAAPKVGTKAPKVSAKMIDLPLSVDLAQPKRTTVLIFGSWT